MWQKGIQRSLLRQFIACLGLGVLVQCIAVVIADLCAVFKEEGAGVEFRLADTHSIQAEICSFQAEFLLVELKASLVECV